MRASILVLLCLGLTAVASTANGPPPISDEIALDHQFRYGEWVGFPRRCEIGVLDTTVYLLYAEGDGLWRYRRGLDGSEIDINGTRMSYGGDIWAFDLAPFDGLDWKLAFVPGYYGSELRIAALDPETFESREEIVVDSDGGGEIFCPTLAYTGELHLLAWIEQTEQRGTLKFARFTRDLELLDAEPITITSELRHGMIGLAADDTSGLLLWSDADRSLLALPLDRDGLPDGEPTAPGLTHSWGQAQIDLCRFRGDWMIAWNAPEGIGYALLDRTGRRLLQRRIPDFDAEFGLAVSVHDSVATIAWRAREGTWDDLPVLASIIDRDAFIHRDPVVLDTYAPFCEGGDRFDEQRHLTCTWTGERFAVLWSRFECLETSKRIHDSTTDPNRYGSCDGEPIYSQWLDLDGTPQFEEPVLVSQMSRPQRLGVHHTGEGFLAVSIDGDDPKFLHVVRFDETGRSDGEPFRIWTRDEENECTFWVSSHDWIWGLKLRSFGNEALALYGYSYWYLSELGTHIERESIFFDRIGPDGSRISRKEIAVDLTVPAEAASSYDVAGGEGGFLIAYSTSDAPRQTRAILVDSLGMTLHEWDVLADSGATHPAVASLGERFLMVWVEGSTETARLVHAILDPGESETAVAGRILLLPPGVYGVPTLVRGPEQTLLVFPARIGEPGHPPPDDFDVYAVRFDAAGVQVESVPRALDRTARNAANVDGVWDSNQYFIVWANTDNPGRNVYGARIGENGAVIDSIGFLIEEGSGNVRTPRLASDDVGNVAVVYEGRKLRLVEDLIPLLDEGDDWFDEEEPFDPADTVSTDRFIVGAVCSNPGRGEIRVAVVVPVDRAVRLTIYDARGRSILRRTIRRGDLLSEFVWDGHLANGRLAPAGTYFLRFSDGRENRVRKAMLLR